MEHALYLYILSRNFIHSKKEVNIGKLDKSKIACNLQSRGRKVRGKALLER